MAAPRFMSTQIPPKAAAATIIGFVVVMIVGVCQEVRDELADDFKTIDGKEYKNATVSHVEPDVEQNAKLEALRKQQEEAMRQRQAATAISSSRPAVTPDPIKPTATSGIETLRPRKAPPVTEQLHRIGAICRDGSKTGLTGRGACSRHRGVRCWKYSDGTCH